MNVRPPTGTSPICFLCARGFHVERGVGWVCDAFRQGVPKDVLVSRMDHRLPYRGDGGLRFEAMPTRLATDPPVSQAQRRAMWAAANGKSSIGIPKSVAEEFTAADPGGSLPQRAKDMEPGDWRGLIRGLLKFFAEEKRETEHAEDAAPMAASIAFVEPGGKVLFVKRGANEQNYPDHWAWPGGKADGGETAEDCARREAAEEIGWDGDAELRKIDQKRTSRGWDHHTFAAPVEQEFEPTLNHEHSEHSWAYPHEAPQPLHPGVKATLDGVIRGAEDAEFEDRDGGLHPVAPLENANLPETARALAGEYGKDVALALDWRGVATLADEGARPAFLAFDRGSARSYDSDGRLHLDESNISKAAINPYKGSEIPDYEELGLDPEKIYQLLRHPDELAKGAPTFNNLPILSTHQPVTVDDHQPDLIVGSTGTDARFNPPYLANSLVVWARKALDGIESKRKKQISAAYRYRADMSPGTYEGKHYDGIMRDIKGNHVALVEEGRAGPDVVVGDSKRGTIMTSTRMSPAAIVAQGALLGYLRGRLAQDAKVDLPAILAGVNKKNFKERSPAIESAVRAAVRGHLAQDADVEEIKDLLGEVEAAVEQIGGGESDMSTASNSGAPPAAMRTDEDEDDGSKGELLDFLEDKIDPEDLETAAHLLGESQETVEDMRHRFDAADRRRAEDRQGAKDASAEDRAGWEAEDKRRAEDRRRAEDAILSRDARARRAMDALKTRRAADARHKLGRDETPEEMREREMGEQAHDRRRAADARRTAADRKRRAEDRRRLRTAADEPADFPGKPKLVTQDALTAAVKQATDEALGRQRGVRDAERMVRPYVGELAIAYDSAAEVYRAALKTMGYRGVDEIHESALRPMVENHRHSRGQDRREPAIAADTAAIKSFSERFPGAANIRRA